MNRLFGFDVDTTVCPAANKHTPDSGQWTNWIDPDGDWVDIAHATCRSCHQPVVAFNYKNRTIPLRWWTPAFVIAEEPW